MRWWKRRRLRARYEGLEFEIAGDPDVAAEWVAKGGSGPLAWEARLRRLPDEVRWTLRVEGTLTGTVEREGAAINQYVAATECRAALRDVVDDHNDYVDVAG